MILVDMDVGIDVDFRNGILVSSISC
jgi:hypothetical protein